MHPSAVDANERDTIMFIAAWNDNEVNARPFRAGDIVRSQSNDETCVVIWTRGDWLWLDPVESVDAAPFSGRAHDYELMRRGLA